METEKKEQLILKIIKYFPVILILICSIFITSYFSYNYLSDFEKEKIKIKNDFLKLNKDRIKININSISNVINTKITNSREKLNEELSHKINVAHHMATNIYEKNKNKLSKDEIINHIKNSLEALRFNKGQGYFSLHTMKGKNILHPIRKEFEGSSVLDKRDITGKYTVREAIEIAKTMGEGFMSWYSVKPNDKTKVFKKIGIIKRFEPYDLIITTGRFYDEYMEELKKELINLLKVIKYQNDGYVFIMDMKGNLLLTRSDLTNVSGNISFYKKFLEFANSKKVNSYLEYKYNVNEKEYTKISFLKKIDTLDWIIATGFNYDYLRLLINEKQESLEEEYNNHLFVILVVSIIITLILLLLFIFLSKLIESIFYEYKERLIEKESIKFETILEELNLILDHLPMMMIFKDTKNNIIRVNKTLADSLNLSVGELRNVTSKDIFPNDYEKYYEDDLEIIKTKKEKVGLIEHYITPKGERTIETSKIPIFDKNGEVQNIIIFIIDITEQESLLEDNEKKDTLLYQQSKMAAMGEMIANIAHQWKQPLSTITVSSSGIKLQKEMNILSNEELDAALDTITTSAQYLSQTIDDFKNFFNPKANNYKVFKISEVIEKTLKFLLPKYKTQNIEIIKDIENMKIRSLENEIIQVLINILNNSRDELIKYNQRRLIFIKTYKKDNFLILEIKDNAKGIKKDIKDKIFDAYFTTKDSNEGTGIGLYMSKNILTKLLNADIKVENETFIYEDKEYTGAKFIIKFNLETVKST